MNEKDKELNKLRNENARLRDEVAELRTRVAALQMDITRWEHCHRQDMEDNLRLKNQVAQLLGVNNGGTYGRNEDRTG